ncbi:DUF300-domain-containing protein [Basidiobolus meristosporus CBS 931.73]|uniref:DUF300-domain-containing protein n=1 Tax=Basidiobolus meristosporus CBS 931.73 TaxID=1314790 RepID=A0A1Y1Y3G8_9FUNG|nr:DUF300-domain-containing protein [Basidiobolus meristosporus CBS 931.73]|eukprot:ORX92425.1 DUF300-domain-containing protein [Basidiobolus meristosporus CBS 931.73]
MDSTDNSGAGSEIGNTAVWFAGFFSILATGISFFCMWSHLKNYARPNLQRNVLRIIWMIPVYAISSWISLHSLEIAFYVDALRDVYEAFVLYCFFNLLVNYLGGERELLSLLHGRKPAKHMWPVNWWSKEIDIGDPYNFLFVKRGILQYVYVKPVLAVATMALKVCNNFNEGDLSMTSGYFWVSFVYNLSVCLSLYCLVLFFMAAQEDLKPYRPFPKFICVKSVIFFSFWQGLGISILVMLGIIRGTDNFNADQLAVAIQDFLICFEMVFAAIGHWHSFTYKDYNNYDLHFGRMTLSHAIRDALGLRDIIQDSLETYSGERFNYRAFEPAEGIVPEGPSRNQRILAGLRYVDGGQTKYWIPTPEPGSKTALYLSQNQCEHDNISLEFPDIHDPENSEDYYEAARQLVHGDYNYPIITVSSPTHQPNENQSIKGKRVFASYAATEPSSDDLNSPGVNPHIERHDDSCKTNFNKGTFGSAESPEFLGNPSGRRIEQGGHISAEQANCTEATLQSGDLAHLEELATCSAVAQSGTNIGSPHVLHKSRSSIDSLGGWYKQAVVTGSRSSLGNPWS